MLLHAESPFDDLLSNCSRPSATAAAYLIITLKKACKDDFCLKYVVQVPYTTITLRSNVHLKDDTNHYNAWYSLPKISSIKEQNWRCMLKKPFKSFHAEHHLQGWSRKDEIFSNTGKRLTLPLRKKILGHFDLKMSFFLRNFSSADNYILHKVVHR